MQGDSLVISGKTLEYFLFIFRQQKMWAEIIDLCDSFNQFTGASDEAQSEIKNYYLSNALLEIPSK